MKNLTDKGKHAVKAKDKLQSLYKVKGQKY